MVSILLNGYYTCYTQQIFIDKNISFGFKDIFCCGARIRGRDLILPKDNITEHAEYDHQEQS